jgi:hypothetical protein
MTRKPARDSAWSTLAAGYFWLRSVFGADGRAASSEASHRERGSAMLASMGLLYMTEFARATGHERTPTTRTYWVVPERLLAGAYPGSPRPAEHRDRIESLWNAGVRTFINLMA